MSWAIEFWLRGIETDRVGPLIFSCALVVLATLTKYFGLALIPLLLAYTLMGHRRRHAVWLVIPAAAATAYELLTKAAYGHGLLLSASHVAYGAWDKSHLALGPQAIAGLCFTGGCLFTVAFFLRVHPRTLSIALLIGLLAFRFLVPINPDWALGDNTALVKIEGGVFAGIGLVILCLALSEWWRYRQGATTLLLLWIAGTFVFSVFLNWSITARTLLPLVPPVAILALRSRPHISAMRAGFGFAFAAITSLILTASDFSQANASRKAAQGLGERFRAEPGTVWFQSHWGFQYYMQQWKARPINVQDFHFASGDVIVIPANNTAIRQIDTSEVFTPEEMELPLLPWATTFAYTSGACFYSSRRGPLPWAVDRFPPELFYVARFR